MRISKQQKFFIPVAILFLAYCSPVLFFPRHTRFLVHDNLDGLVPLYKFLGNPSVMYSGFKETVEGIMGGIPRFCLPGPFSFFRLLFVLFPPLTAYAIHFIFQHVIAGTGMFLLLKSVLKNSNGIEKYYIPLAFAMLPFWPGGELTVAGLPFLVWALLATMQNQAKPVHWTIIVLFPFFSSLPFGNMFSFPILFLGCAGLLLSRKQKPGFRLFLAFALLGVSTFIAEFNTIYAMLSGFESNRIADPGLQVQLNLKGVTGASILAFLSGHYHFHSMHQILLSVIIMVMVYMFVKGDRRTARNLFVSLTVLFILYFLTILLNNAGIGGGFKVNVRFWVLFPLLWYVLAAWAMSLIKNEGLRGIAATFSGLWVMFMFYPKDYYGSEYAENPFFYTINKDEEHQTFSEYFLVREMDELKKNYPEVCNADIMCLGMNPGKALFNGFRTFDAYLNFYPLEKWKTFEKINREEFNRGGVEYYSNNRAYLYSSEHEKGQQVENPLWDKQEMRTAGVKYILSTVPVRNHFDSVGASNPFYLYSTRQSENP